MLLLSIGGIVAIALIVVGRRDRTGRAAASAPAEGAGPTGCAAASVPAEPSPPDALSADALSADTDALSAAVSLAQKNIAE